MPSLSIVACRALILVLAAALALFATGPQTEANAQPAEPAGICGGAAEASLDDRISACSSLINTQNGEDSERLAVLHTIRGAFWRAKGDLDHAPGGPR